MAQNRGKVTPRPELAQPFAYSSTGDQTTPGAMLPVIAAPRPATYSNIPAADQTTPGAMLGVIGAPRPIPL